MREIRSYGSVGEPVGNHRLYPEGYVFEVLDMDRHRVDKVLVIPAKSGTDPTPGEGKASKP